MKNHDEEKAKLSKKIKKFREEKNLSQNQLARLSGVSAQNISKYEQGISVPSALVLKRIAQVLEVTSDTLLNENGLDGRVVKMQDVELLRKIQQVDQLGGKDKEAIERFLDLIIFRHSVKQLD